MPPPHKGLTKCMMQSSDLAHFNNSSASPRPSLALSCHLCALLYPTPFALFALNIQNYILVNISWKSHKKIIDVRLFKPETFVISAIAKYFAQSKLYRIS